MALDIGGFYSQWWMIIDFFVYFLIFGSIAMYVFGKNYGKEGSIKGMALAFGFALSIAMIGLEYRNGFNIWSMGCVVAVFLILAVCGFFAGALIKKYPKEKWWFILGALLLALVLINLFFSTGMCASPFFGTGGGGYTASSAPWYNKSGVGIPGGQGWLDWLLLLAAIIGMYWLIVQFGGNVGPGSKDRDSYKKYSDYDRHKRSGSEDRKDDRFELYTFLPHRLPRGCRTGFRLTGRGIKNGVEIRLALSAISGTGVGTGVPTRPFTRFHALNPFKSWWNVGSNVRIVDGITLRVIGNVEETDEGICTVLGEIFVPNVGDPGYDSNFIADGFRYDVWVTNSDGKREVLRAGYARDSGFTVDDSAPCEGPPTTTPVLDQINELYALCHAMENAIVGPYITHSNQMSDARYAAQTTGVAAAWPTYVIERNAVNTFETNLATDHLNDINTLATTLNGRRGDMTGGQESLFNVINHRRGLLAGAVMTEIQSQNAAALADAMAGTAPTAINYGSVLTAVGATSPRLFPPR